jgi:hypothetical protein
MHIRFLKNWSLGPYIYNEGLELPDFPDGTCDELLRRNVIEACSPKTGKWVKTLKEYQDEEAGRKTAETAALAPPPEAAVLRRPIGKKRAEESVAHVTPGGEDRA